MRHCSRIRRWLARAGLGGLLLTTLLVTVVSLLGRLDYYTLIGQKGVMASLGSRGITVSRVYLRIRDVGDAGWPQGFKFVAHPNEPQAVQPWADDGVMFPLWLLFMLLGVPTVWLLWPLPCRNRLTADPEPHPTLRRCAKWGGLTTTLLLGFVWVVSIPWVWSYLERRSLSGSFYTLVLSLRYGCATWFSRHEGGSIVEKLFLVERAHGPTVWMPFLERRPDYWEIGLPLWIPLVVTASATMFLFWRDNRRRPPGHCRCGYDLTGNTSGMCPECGKATATTSNSVASASSCSDQQEQTEVTEKG